MLLCPFNFLREELLDFDQAMWDKLYLDYEAKYGQGVENSKLIDAFLAKLANKGQFSGLGDQACRAVPIYLELSDGPTPGSLSPESRPQADNPDSRSGVGNIGDAR